MALGRTSNVESFQGNPPLYGSFPVDHFGTYEESTHFSYLTFFPGECTTYMKEYMKCLRANKNNNGACREFSRTYLQCRMDRGLMDKDDMKNLGFADLEKDAEKTNTSS
ncbi:Cytochrome c oxidase assembly protein cox19 [Apophysomyces sp. BC1034]|nr:Cytochrome c oxidase assembly protein cox19 [Apophysomyces sp. BC1015]KAG0190602.1 Cytochrome c oxidase assembly protein cox19 [Apophysomyces sp. BC1034]